VLRATLAAWLALVPVAHAYTRSDALTSARACAGESGWHSYEHNECIAIIGVHQRRAAAPANRGRSLAAVTRAYSSALNGNRPWILRLGLPGWPRGVSRRYELSWRRILSQAEDYLLRGVGRNPCPSAEHYGSRADGPPGPGYVRVCANLGFRSHMWRKVGYPHGQRMIRPVRLPRRG
jgi:hypothetical protein